MLLQRNRLAMARNLMRLPNPKGRSPASGGVAVEL
jgi:hypothetical protein